MSTTRTAFTPPQIAAQLGRDPETVIAWIRSGELPAFNAATKPNGRPRYLVTREGLEQFIARRSVQPPPPVQRRRKRASGHVIEFF